MKFDYFFEIKFAILLEIANFSSFSMWLGLKIIEIFQFFLCVRM